jgi:hypothetical protein
MAFSPVYLCVPSCAGLINSSAASLEVAVLNDQGIFMRAHAVFGGVVAFLLGEN